MQQDKEWLRKVAKSQHMEEARLFAIAELTPNGRSILDLVFWPSEADNLTITNKMKEMEK